MQVLKYLLLITLCLLCHTQLIAQKWAYGVNLDLNYSTVNGKGLQHKMKLGYGGGVWATYSVTKKLKLQPELWLTQYNYTKAEDFDKYYKTDAGRVNANVKIRLANVAVPFLFRYDIIQWVSVYMGPQLSLTVFNDENLRKDGVKAFNPTELSVCSGLEVNLGTVGIFGRYMHGISNISNMSDKYRWNSQHADFGISLRIK